MAAAPVTDPAITAAIALLEAVGEKPSIRRVAELIRTASGNKGARWATIAAALKVLPGNTPGNTRATPGQQFDEGRATPGQHPGNATRARADHKGVVTDSLFGHDEQGTSLPSVVKSPRGAARQQRRVLALPLDAERDRQIGEVLDAVRGRVEPVLQGQTWTAWRTKQRNAIRGMLAAGRTPDEIVDRWDDLCERRGYVVLTLAWVAEDFDRPDAPAARDTDAPPPFYAVSGSWAPLPERPPPTPRPFTPSAKMLATLRELHPGFAAHVG